MQTKMKQLLRLETSTQLLLLIALLLPFDYLPTLPVGDLRLRMSSVVAILLVIRVAWIYAKNRRIDPSISRLELLLSAWVAWLLIESLQTTIPHTYIKVVAPLVLLTLMAMVLSRAWTQKRTELLLKALFVGTAIAALFGLYQFVANRYGAPQSWTGLRPEYSWERFGFPRLQSVALEPLYFSAFLLLPISLLLALMAAKREYRRLPYVGLLGLLLVVDFLTLSRGGLAALIIMLCILGALLWRPGVIKRHAKVIGLTVVALVVAFVLVLGVIASVAGKGNDSDLTYNQHGIGSYIAHLKDSSFFANKSNITKNDSIAQRETARSQAMQVLTNKPTVLLFGVGPGQYAEYVKANHLGVIYTAPNNMLLEQLIATGIVGTLLLLSFLILLIVKLVRAARARHPESYLAAAIGAYLIAIVLQTQTFSGLNLTHLWFAIGLGLFLVQWNKVTTKTKHETKTAPQRRTRPNH